MIESKVKIYKLVEPEELFKFEKLLPKILFDLPKKDDDYIFNISPMSGWIYYSNLKEIRKNNSIQHLPKNESEVKQAVRNYLSSVTEKFSRERSKNSKFTLTGVFPDKIVSQQISPVFNSETGLIDHWIASFQPFLRGGNSSGEVYFPVRGSNINFRIGNYGKIIGLSSNWRGVSSNIKVPLLPIPINNNEHEHNNHHDQEDVPENEEKNICYFDKGEYIFQHYLCPFYYTLKGHHLDLIPASKISMVIDIIEDHHDNQVDLYASVNGGSGSFYWEWASWKIEEMEDSYVDLGREPKITLDIGAYTVSLTVTDLKTNVIEQINQLVYCLINSSNKVNSLT